jgi:CBS domain-containing protein
MLVKFIMTLDVEWVSDDTSIQEAARLMKTLDVGSIPVRRADGEIVGMLTDRDLAIRAAAEGLDPITTKVRDVMTVDVVYCYEDQDVQDAVRLMEGLQLRRLLVLNRDNQLAGILSLGDLAVRANGPNAAEVLKEVSEMSWSRIGAQQS